MDIVHVLGQRTSGECWKQALTAVGNRVKLQFGLRNQPELLNFQGSTNNFQGSTNQETQFSSN